MELTKHFRDLNTCEAFLISTRCSLKRKFLVDIWSIGEVRQENRAIDNQLTGSTKSIPVKRKSHIKRTGETVTIRKPGKI